MRRALGYSGDVQVQERDLGSYGEDGLLATALIGRGHNPIRHALLDSHRPLIFATMIADCKTSCARLDPWEAQDAIRMSL